MEAGSLGDTFGNLVTSWGVTLQDELTSTWLPINVGAVVLATLIAAGIAALLRRRFDPVGAMARWPAPLRAAVQALIDNLGVLIFLVLAAAARGGMLASAVNPRTTVLDIALNLAVAWLVIAVLASVIRNPFVNRVVAVIAWTVAALSILGLLDDVIAALDAAAVMVGGVRVSLLLVLKTVLLLLVALWIAAVVSKFLERQVQDVPELTPSMQVLLGKVIRIAVMVVAVIIVLSTVGIDLSVLAVFTGAIGVGLGFGLQKIVSNFVCGVILLADKSIKPGDVLTIGDSFGRVATMGARYTSLDLRDGRALLVPNEDLVTQKVTNWSFTSRQMRLEVKFNTTYDSDMQRTRAVAVQAAQTVPEVLGVPPPVCHLAAFGSTALEYVLWFWIEEATAGPTAVRSAVLIALWETFAREGIVIPKPGPSRVILEQPR